MKFENIEKEIKNEYINIELKVIDEYEHMANKRIENLKDRLNQEGREELEKLISDLKSIEYFKRELVTSVSNRKELRGVIYGI
ncbi:TPA: hypothetical protein K8N36_002995 [Clostridium perfringens]|uniref:hypothetical protein n=1 Tax=Clostridium perfringens TaxID=1502 RepID=UPI001CB413B0|nr:hypothetical protein [Clostridium perfringens]HBI6884210.1 hypothetical protein [Clostridium perfringens]HBI6902028.1 hypothetical protein [Clostridium perfringens]HBI6931007.1 hypothetical protein [Clostridium perfringens]HBI6941168.1 hypothetical protein [Clostridium perfringens]